MLFLLPFSTLSHALSRVLICKNLVPKYCQEHKFGKEKPPLSQERQKFKSAFFRKCLNAYHSVNNDGLMYGESSILLLKDVIDFNIVGLERHLKACHFIEQIFSSILL